MAGPAPRAIRKPTSAITGAGTRIERPGVMDLVTIDDAIEKLEAALGDAPART